MEGEDSDYEHEDDADFGESVRSRGLSRSNSSGSQGSSTMDRVWDSMGSIVESVG